MRQIRDTDIPFQVMRVWDGSLVRAPAMMPPIKFPNLNSVAMPVTEIVHARLKDERIPHLIVHCEKWCSRGGRNHIKPVFHENLTPEMLDFVISKLQRYRTMLKRGKG